MVQVVYQFFNSFGFNKKFAPLFSEQESEQNEEEPVILKTESLSEKSKSDTKEPTHLKQINLNEIIKPLWIKLSRSNFVSLTKDVVNNLDDKDYQTKINNERYDLKNAEQFLLEIITKKSENETRKLYENFIEPKNVELKNAKGKGKNKRSKILTILENIILGIFDGLSDCNWTRTQNHLVRKQTKWFWFGNHLAKWLSVRLQTKWFCVRFQLQSLKLQILRLLRAKSSLTFRQLQSVDSL